MITPTPQVTSVVVTMAEAAVSNSCSVLTTPWVEMIEVERFNVRTVEGYERHLSNFKGDLLLVAYISLDSHMSPW